MPVQLIAIYHGAKAGASVVNMAARYLDDSVNLLFNEIAEVHFTSAGQAFAAAAIMTDVAMRRSELQVANGHLRDAFNGYQRFLGRRRNVVSAFVNSAALLENKVNALSRSIEIATLIAVTYAEVGSEFNARQWRDEAWRQFALYDSAYRQHAKNHSWVPDPPHNMVFMEASFQASLQQLESERGQLSQIFQAKGIT